MSQAWTRSWPLKLDSPSFCFYPRLYIAKGKLFGPGLRLEDTSESTSRASYAFSLEADSELD